MATHTCTAARHQSQGPGIEIPDPVYGTKQITINDRRKEVAREIRKALTPIINKKWNYVSDRHRNRLVENEITRVLKEYVL